MRYCELRLDQPGWMEHPMQAFIRESDAVAYEELLGWNVLAARDVAIVLFYVVGDRAAYESALQDVAPIRWYTVTPVDEGAFYVYACEDTREGGLAFRSAFADLELVVIPPVRFDDRGRVTLTLVGAADTFQQLLAALPDDVDATVAALGEYDRRHATLAGALTDRQHEAVRAAVEVGYYETPAAGSLADVGAALGCAPSTASNLLSRAEAAIMGRVVSGRDADQ